MVSENSWSTNDARATANSPTDIFSGSVIWVDRMLLLEKIIWRQPASNPSTTNASTGLGSTAWSVS